MLIGTLPMVRAGELSYISSINSDGDMTVTQEHLLSSDFSEHR